MASLVLVMDQFLMKSQMEPEFSKVLKGGWSIFSLLSIIGPHSTSTHGAGFMFHTPCHMQTSPPRKIKKPKMISFQSKKISKKKVPRKKKAIQRVEFAAIFQNHPINGVNHGKASSQDIFTTIGENGTLSFAQTTTPTSLVLLWTSTPVSYQNGTFSNSGSVALAFSSNSSVIASINFQSNTLGQARNGPNSGDAYGGITYAILHGTGYWKTAQGTMIDMFIAPASDTTFPILVWAIFWI